MGRLKDGIRGMTTTPRPERRPRRFLQFSLRSLLVFVLLVSIGMSWLGVKMERARRQREAVEAIEKAGTVCHESDPFGVRSLIGAFTGQDLVSDVAIVWCGREFGDDEAGHLKALTDLIHLDLAASQITDDGLEHLESLTILNTLSLSRTQVSDAGLEHLEGLTRLHYLDLSNTQLTGPELENLNGLANLTTLILCDTPVTNVGLKHLAGLTTLEHLNLARTQVTDAGLEHLTGLTNLTYLDLSGPRVTPEGVKKLQEALPHCEIVN